MNMIAEGAFSPGWEYCRPHFAPDVPALAQDGTYEVFVGRTPWGLQVVRDSLTKEELPFVCVSARHGNGYDLHRDAGRQYETWIVFADAAGAKAAWRVARWLLNGDETLPLLIDGKIAILAGQHHRRWPAMKALWAAGCAMAPQAYMPWNATGVTCEVGLREALSASKERKAA